MRRLFRAEAAGKITFGRVVVVDRDPLCAAASLVSGRVRLEVASWNDWLAENLSRHGMGDHLVPYHWAPHVLLDWLAADLARHGLTLRRTSEPGDPPARPPVLRATQAGDLAMSYAEWLCPPACIEPALCPHTRGPRDWSLCGGLEAGPGPAESRIVWRCLHHAWGVGTIPVGDVLAGRERLLAEAGRAEGLWLVATASHCHGLAAWLRAGPAGLA